MFLVDRLLSVLAMAATLGMTHTVLVTGTGKCFSLIMVFHLLMNLLYTLQVLAVQTFM